MCLEQEGEEGEAAGSRSLVDGGAVLEGGEFVYDTAQEAAGHSELQTAFERAYERMLREPPPSVRNQRRLCLF